MLDRIELLKIRFKNDFEGRRTTIYVHLSETSYRLNKALQLLEGIYD